MSRITRITIGRLYSLGNYEHVRYELTVEVPEGESAARAIKSVERIIAGLAPIKFVKSGVELQRMGNEIEEMKKMPMVDWERRYGHCTGTAAEVIARYQKSLEEEMIKSQDAIDRARKARELFDNLGGAEHWKDAKLDWEDYENNEL